MKLKHQLTVLFLLFFGLVRAQNLPKWGFRVSSGFVSPILAFQDRGMEYVRTGYELGLEGSEIFNLGSKTELELPIGIFFSQLPKSKNYQDECLRESFLTYLSYDDSLMGRDMRFVEVRLSPTIRFWLGSKIGLATSLWASLGLYTGIEDYEKVCDREREPSFIHLEDSAERDVQKLNLGWDSFLSIKAFSGDKFRLLIEPGFGWRFSKRTEVYIYDESSQLRTLSGFFRLGGYF